MSGRRELFGTYRPRKNWLHRLPVGVKGLALLFLAVSLALPWQRWIPALHEPWVVPLCCVGLLMALGATGGLGWASWWSTVRPALPIFVLLAGYHVLVGTPQRGSAVLLTVLAAMFATRILLETTPQAVLLDGLVRMISPLRVVGVNPERVGLAIQIMLRAIPYLLGVVHDVRQAGAARGLRLGPVRLATPAVISAVAHAQRTGEALVARGLEEPRPGNPRASH
ncbi:energy-coupling factor transporter transmembrane component T family protein [Kocuria sp.]|uniref:energy-coupling factor transporter transmembrane component T family protein n=1 Tax=Kocuria sp. TaxID=1871328 RepID=UPI0026E0CC4A|nr:energy-coupling factor transporter transmembrane protein EcfT [Kocuria sp.]MDO5617770.1 energy-coupling factor transporter transmembrane protein EcfT [Kocuria sp.]